MRAHCVGFVSATPAEIRSGVAFREAARFCQWESTVVIRCEETGQDVQVHCAPCIHGYEAEHFASEWARKHNL